MEKNKVKITVCGADYTIISEDKESYIKEVSQEVDTRIKRFLEKNPKASISMAAVLVALDFCDQYKKSASLTEEFRNQIKKYISENEKCHHGIELLKAENKDLKEKNISLELALREVERKAESSEKEIQKLKIKENIKKMKNEQKELITFSLASDEVLEN